MESFVTEQDAGFNGRLFRKGKISAACLRGGSPHMSLVVTKGAGT